MISKEPFSGELEEAITNNVRGHRNHLHIHGAENAHAYRTHSHKDHRSHGEVVEGHSDHQDIRREEEDKARQEVDPGDHRVEGSDNAHGHSSHHVAEANDDGRHRHRGLAENNPAVGHEGDRNTHRQLEDIRSLHDGVESVNVRNHG